MNRYAPMLLLLAAVWGASYLFIKVAVEEIEPAPMMAARTLLAAAVLFGYLVWRLGAGRAVADLRAAWRHCLVLGVLNAALPFWLIAWGEKHIDSGLAAVVQASVPIFNALLVLRFLPHERLSRTRALGLGIGIVGVGVVTGIHPDGGGLAIVGTLAIVVSSIAYAGAGVYGQRAVAGTAGPVLATGSMLTGGLILLPFALFQIPGEMPGWKALGSVAALSLLGTAFAQLILFRMLALHGSARLSLVTYLMPGFALVYGALLLDEGLSLSTAIGLALILAGITLASGNVPLPRRRPRTREAGSRTMSEELLRRHVERFNEAVRTGEYGPMLEWFAEDAELAFEGIPVGPFIGREAIAAAYAARPPDDEIDLLGLDEREGETVAGYSWHRDKGRRSGELRLTEDRGRISRFVVTFE